MLRRRKLKQDLVQQLPELWLRQSDASKLPEEFPVPDRPSTTAEMEVQNQFYQQMIMLTWVMKKLHTADSCTPPLVY